MNNYFLGNIDRGEALKELLLSQETFFKDNFMSSLMLLGCVILGTHYEHAVGSKRKSPLQWPLDTQTLQSTALECALSVLGRGEMLLGGKKNLYFSACFQHIYPATSCLVIDSYYKLRGVNNSDSSFCINPYSG